MIIMIILTLGTILFFFRPFDHSWFFHQSDEIKNQTKFLNWFQEWWLFFCIIKDFFCPQILKEYKYFSKHGSHLVPTSCSQVLFFLSRFQIPWILYWDFVLSQMIPVFFPAHFPREFKIKWWSILSFSYLENSTYPSMDIFKKFSFKTFFFKGFYSYSS